MVSQKSLTGHAKGGAAAFQLIGLCQVLGQGVVPPNRSLDCVDEKMAEFQHLVWPREPLRFGERFPLKAGLLTSLGFGHVSGLIAVVHPQAFVEAIPADKREEYLEQARKRLVEGQQSSGEGDVSVAPACTSGRRTVASAATASRPQRPVSSRRTCCSPRPRASERTTCTARVCPAASRNDGWEFWGSASIS